MAVITRFEDTPRMSQVSGGSYKVTKFLGNGLSTPYNYRLCELLLQTQILQISVHVYMYHADC